MSTDAVDHAVDPRYPIGRFQRPEMPLAHGVLAEAIGTLAEFPSELRGAVAGFDEEQWDTPYRDGGWTVRQLVSHLADSHMMAFLRVRLALTEDGPTVPPYKEKEFAELRDSVAAPGEWSLQMLESLHARWVMMLQSLMPEQWQRGFTQSERGSQTVEVATLLYSWHARHHLAHIKRLRAAKDW